MTINPKKVKLNQNHQSQNALQNRMEEMDHVLRRSLRRFVLITSGPRMIWISQQQLIDHAESNHSVTSAQVLQLETNAIKRRQLALLPQLDLLFLYQQKLKLLQLLLFQLLFLLKDNLHRIYQLLMFQAFQFAMEPTVPQILTAEPYVVVVQFSVVQHTTLLLLKHTREKMQHSNSHQSIQHSCSQSFQNAQDLMVLMLVVEKFNADKLEDTLTQSGLLKSLDLKRKKRKDQSL